MTLKIGVIGGGVVGKATARAWLEHCNEVLVWDQIKERRTTEDLDAVCKADLVFVCLPEGVLDHFFDAIPLTHKAANFVIKSTVPIGTTRKLKTKFGITSVVHSPEFLTARCAETDAQIPEILIIGSPSIYYDDHIYYDGPLSELVTKLYSLYIERFPGVKVEVMFSDESEAVKLFRNAAYATKVSLFNEFKELIGSLGLRWDAVRQAVVCDSRIGPSHTQVPGPDGKHGFGGTCLPKDLETLMDAYEDVDRIPYVLAGVARRNVLDRDKGVSK